MDLRKKASRLSKPVRCFFLADQCDIFRCKQLKKIGKIGVFPFLIKTKQKPIELLWFLNINNAYELLDIKWAGKVDKNK